MKKDSQKSNEKNRQNVACDYIRENYADRLRYDTIARKVQILKPHPDTGDEQWFYISNEDINSIVCDANYETGATITSREVLTVLNAGDRYIQQFNPFKEYLNSLAPYTGTTDWIDWLASQVTVAPGSEELWRSCFRKWFVGMIAGWMKEGVVNQHVLVLVGKQGIYKTTWLEKLLPPELRNYGAKLTNLSSITKDDRLKFCEFGLLNCDELDAINQRELNVLKSLITTAEVCERPAYGYTKDKRRRVASLCGSTNRMEFLTDQTGNRRWMPFLVENIQSPFDALIPYERVYAQALYLLEHGFNYWLDISEIEVLDRHNEEFRAVEGEEQLLPILFDVPCEGGGIFLTTQQISERLVTFGSIKNPMPTNRLGMVLKAAGYKSVRRRIGNTLTRGYLVYQRLSSEIEALKNQLVE
jgi:predicted P-loop ATPase